MRTLVLATRVTDPARGDPSPSSLLVRGLVDLGHEVHLVCDASEPMRSSEGLTVHAVHSRRSGVLPAFAPRASDAAKRFAPDCVMAERGRLALGWMLAARSGAALVPVLGESHSDEPGWARGVRAPLHGRFVRSADACLAFGPSQADAARSLGAEPVIELPGVSSIEGGVPHATGWLRRHLGLASGLLAVSWGKLAPEEGTDAFIEGVKVAADADADVHAVLLGGDDASIDRYEAKAQRIGIEHRVHLLGAWPASRLAALLAEADIVVEPGTRPGVTPPAFYTCLGSGRPMIVAEAPGRHRLAPDNACAFAPPDRLGLGHVLAELTRHGPVRERLGTAGRSWVADRHSYDQFLKALGAIDRIERRGASAEAGTTRHSEGLSA